MSRTFRRKTESLSFMRAYGCICKESDTHYSWYTKEFVPSWSNRWANRGHVFTEYSEYCNFMKVKFHADGNKNFTNYNSAPREWRNFRNRKLRAAHRNAVKAVRDFDDDVVLEPFIHNVGWDYW